MSVLNFVENVFVWGGVGIPVRVLLSPRGRSLVSAPYLLPASIRTGPTDAQVASVVTGQPFKKRVAVNTAAVLWLYQFFFLYEKEEAQRIHIL